MCIQLKNVQFLKGHVFTLFLWVAVIFIALDGAMTRDTLPFSDGKRFDLTIVERHF
jgi:hypothetical protein